MLDYRRRFTDPVTSELVGMLLGDRLGSGVDRETYVCAWDPSLVVKVCVGEGDFQNIAEWVLWQNAKPLLRKWLAPCERISSSGLVLVMRRCEPCPAHLFPTQVPQVIAEDLHSGNLGLYDGRPVAMDYGRHIATQMGANARRMVAAERALDTRSRRGW